MKKFRFIILLLVSNLSTMMSNAQTNTIWIDGFIYS